VSRRSLLLIALLAAVLRLVSVPALMHDEGPAGALATHLLGDERAYDRWARELAADGSPRERAFYQAPLFPWLLGQLYRALPPTALEPDQAVIPRETPHSVVLVTQSLLGVATALLTALLGARVLTRRAGLMAGLMAAVSGPLLFHETMLLKASLSLLVFLGALHLWLDLLEAPTDRAARPLARRGLALGLLLGLGVLLRGNLLLLLLLVLASLLLPWGAVVRRPAAAALVLAGALLAISPASIHNLALGDPVLSTYQAGSNAAIGNPPGDDPSQGIIYTPLRAGRGDAWFEEVDAVELAQQAAGRELNGREVSAWWWGEVRARWAEQPVTALQRACLKLAHLFHGAEVADVKDWAFVRQAVPWLATPLSDFTLWGPLALLGLVLLPWRARPGLVVLRGGLGVVALTLAIFYVMGRYRLTAAPCLWVLAAGLLDRWPGLWSEGRRARLGAEAAAGALLVTLGLVLPLPSAAGGDHVSYSNAASVLRYEALSADEPGAARRARDRAVDWARRSVEIAPAFPGGRRMLVLSLGCSSPLLTPRSDEAWDAAWRLALLMESLRAVGEPPRDVLAAPLDAVQAATQRLMDLPSRPGGDALAGPLLAFAERAVAQELRSGSEQLELALRLVDQALKFDPDEPLAHVQRGLVLKRLGRPEQAAQAYRRAQDLGQDTLELHNNLGNVLLELGQHQAAEASFLRALELQPEHPVVLRNLERARAAQE